MIQEYQKNKLLALAHKLISQEAAKIIIPAQENSTGFWFGGGNMIDHKGVLYVTGRYRNYGDSRSGVGKGLRGLELAIFRSRDKGGNWEKVNSFSKSELNLPGKEVLSIEGTALHLYEDGVELFISTEKAYNPLPKSLKDFQKPGTGNWSVERIAAPTIEELSTEDIETVVATDDPRFVHIKDPFIFDKVNGDCVLLCCTHPFNWSSSNTAYFVRSKGAAKNDFRVGAWEFTGRGLTWDVAMRRGTDLLRVPKVGPFATQDITLFFYDGGESLRNMDEHNAAIKRPRGYSCEELGGVGFICDENIDTFETLSLYLPEFSSPWGTSCSRYVDTCPTKDGIYVTWQQSQKDLSQPLVMNFVSWDEIMNILED